MISSLTICLACTNTDVFILVYNYLVFTPAKGFSHYSPEAVQCSSGNAQLAFASFLTLNCLAVGWFLCI